MKELPYFPNHVVISTLSIGFHESFGAHLVTLTSLRAGSLGRLIENKLKVNKINIKKTLPNLPNQSLTTYIYIY